MIPEGGSPHTGPLGVNSTLGLGRVASQTRPEGASDARRTLCAAERRWRPRTKHGEANRPSTPTVASSRGMPFAYFDRLTRRQQAIYLQSDAVAAMPLGDAGRLRP